MADHAHARWAHWMQWMFAQGIYNSEGGWVMPAEKVKRWTRQMNTPYHSLPPAEQVSDNLEANKTLEVLKPFIIDLFHLED